MKELIGKSCKLLIDLGGGGRPLTYTVSEVLDVSDTHISFIDKFGQRYSYRIANIAEVANIKERED